MNKTFAENIDIIRNAKRGVEVREGMAESLEYVREFADTVKEKVDMAVESAASASASANTAASSEKICIASSAAASASEKAAKSSEEKAEAAANRATVIAGGTDETLSTRGAAADAKAVGEALKNYLGIRTVTLAAGGWVSSDDMPGYPYKYTAVLEAASASMLPSAVPVFATLETASEAGLANVCETQNGTVSFWAENVPTGDIRMQVSLIGQSSKEG